MSSHEKNLHTNRNVSSSHRHTRSRKRTERSTNKKEDVSDHLSETMQFNKRSMINCSPKKANDHHKLKPDSAPKLTEGTANLLGRASLLGAFGRSSTEKFGKMFKLQKKTVADDDVMLEEENILSG